ncbi:Chitin binding domain-containing protein [Pseudobacteriovorax antillogorgiicola]|uniref:Chitin binding domain-containing protein n=1 Tax=Pseudobacteriovorax antillogorgiicola TaxID=1513793 RepID=A0A1Y6CMF1_9BACT|nr:lytic polysaccharide monooxygenase [Pseudobacteriovorax antillogorgiicola]TCS47305.1 chitin binding protein [Pseudobacteriovorax antillogorgiicola]SMF62598.1 Chitin binding domain-containing protein [Pseudobacteriovorax antillogorgiicola]
MKTLFNTLCILIFLSYPILALAHGYMSEPKSRSLLCKEGSNQNCGAVQYEPQSVEGPDGFPEAGAADGQIAAAASASWSPLNEQSPGRWNKVAIKSGTNTFSWHFTAPHVTKDWRYFLTKPDWNPSEPLSRQAFDLEPFCVVDGAMAKPPADISHDCQLPERSGYHVILALWDVGDTAATFYQVIDVDFNGSNGGGDGTPGDSNSPDTDNGNPSFPTGDDCDDEASQLSQTTSKLLCNAKPFSGADAEWCNENCNQVPSFCPKDLCECQ